MSTCCDARSASQRRKCAPAGVSPNLHENKGKHTGSRHARGGEDAKTAHGRGDGAAACQLDPALLVPRLGARTRIGAIKELIDRLHGRAVTPDSLQFLQSVLERDSLGHTMVADGVALPHARCRSVQRLAVALGLAVPPVEYASGDQIGQVDVIGLIAVPEWLAGPYLQLHAALAQRLADAQVRHRLRAAVTAGEMETALGLSEPLARAACRPERAIPPGEI